MPGTAETPGPRPEEAGTAADTIFIACPHCRHQKKAPARFAGRQAKCPKCDKSFVVPSVGAPAAHPASPPPMPLVEYRPRREVGDPDDDYRPIRPRRRRRREREEIGFRCPFCNTPEPPLWRAKVSTAGWVCFVLLLLFFCWPICWVGLLMKDWHSVCARCGMRLD